MMVFFDELIIYFNSFCGKGWLSVGAMVSLPLLYDYSYLFIFFIFFIFCLKRWEDFGSSAHIPCMLVKLTHKQ